MTTLEIRDNTVKTEAYKLANCLRNLGCRGIFLKNFLIKTFTDYELENPELLPKAMMIFGILHISNNTECEFNFTNCTMETLKGIVCCASSEKNKLIKACIDYLKQNGYVVRTK